MVPEVNPDPYIKAAFASSNASFLSREVHDSAEDRPIRYGTPQPYDALAVITAEHPNYSTSTVNLTLTVCDHSSVRSTSPEQSSSGISTGSAEPDESAEHYRERKQLSPDSATSSSPFTLDRSSSSGVDSPGDWVDTSSSSATRSRSGQVIIHGLVTPTKSKLTPAAEEKDGMLSPYTYGLNPISKAAVDAWSPSKAFADTDRKARLHAGAIEGDTSHTTTESGEGLLNDSLATQSSGATSELGEHAPIGQGYSEIGHVTAGAARSKVADTSLDSGYTASFNAECYTTPPKSIKQKSSHVRCKERDAKAEVSNDIFSVSWSHMTFYKIIYVWRHRYADTLTHSSCPTKCCLTATSLFRRLVSVS